MKWIVFAIVIFILVKACSGTDKKSALPVTATKPASAVKDASWAGAADVTQAEKFLSELPAACARSYADAQPDGAIDIRLLCNGNGQSMDGLVQIKNGIVTKIR